MIHAYLFVLNIREGNGGHGPNFHKIMYNINKTAGTNITVYHTFHDEVNLYKTHVWRCNGICQHRKPFFGYVKRTANRAPGPNDLWWKQHQTSCGGYYEKISAPEPKRKPKNASTSKAIKVVDDRQKINSPHWGFNTSATKIPTSTPITKKSAASPPKLEHGNLTNVFGFKDLQSSTPKRSTVPIAFASGSGFVLGQSKDASKSKTNNGGSIVDNVRDRWSKKYETPTHVDDHDDQPPKPKKAKIEFKPSTAEWAKIDDDIQVMDKRESVIILKDSDDDDDDDVHEVPHQKPIKQSSEDRRKTIRKEIIDSNDSDDGNESDIELIDDEFDDNIPSPISTLIDNHVINDIFGTDTLMSDFNEINDVVMKDADNFGQTNKEIITCPVCQERMQREQLDDHLDGCLGITAKINIKPPSYSSGSTKKRAKATATNSIAAATSTGARSERQLLIDCGYDESVVDKLLKEAAEEEAYNNRILREMSENGEQRSQATTNSVSEEKQPCPVCQGLIETSKINDHLDVCLTNN